MVETFKQPLTESWIVKGKVSDEMSLEAITIPGDAAATSYKPGQVLGQLTATPGSFRAVAVGDTDGLAVADCVLVREVEIPAGGDAVRTVAMRRLGTVDKSKLVMDGDAAAQAAYIASLEAKHILAR
ncbi:MAG: head decoration protein [Henriciella sp.]|nr:head decoration protein [Henriciella sp.]